MNSNRLGAMSKLLCKLSREYLECMVEWSPPRHNDDHKIRIAMIDMIIEEANKILKDEADER